MKPDFENIKACNLCRRFQGLGEHWIGGKCPVHEVITLWEYEKFAKDCDDFEKR